ncbi:MAG: hypothetical protein ACRDD8_15055 [Bacteroidales bacterium]
MNKFLLIVLCIVSVGLLISVNTVIDARNDVLSATDSLTVVKKLNGELVYKMESYDVSISKLKHTNNELYNEIKHLKDNPIVVFKTKIEYVIDTIKTESTKDSVLMGNGIKRYNFHWYNNNHPTIDISGTTMIQLYDNIVTDYETTVDNTTVKIDLLCSVSENKDKVIFQIAPKNPNVKIESIEGYSIYNKRNKPKKIGLSVFGGPSYGFNNRAFDLSIGVGISYDILQLF